jgi:hypothetical protein
MATTVRAGAGTGLRMLKEGLMAYHVQMLSDGLEAAPGAVFTLAREESIAEVRVGGSAAWPAPGC